MRKDPRRIAQGLLAILTNPERAVKHVLDKQLSWPVHRLWLEVHEELRRLRGQDHHPC